MLCMATPTLSRTLLLRAHRVAVDAVLRAAVMATTRGQRAAARAPRRKGRGDFVTAIDLACERALHRELAAGLPEAGFLGEETPSRSLDRDFVWVVDPIDGTSNFANGLPPWAVAVALLHQGRPVVAAIWSEPEGALYDAVEGAGARCNGRQLAPVEPRWDDGSIVGCQWHRGQQRMGFLAAIQRDGARIRTFGSTVVQMLDVACGRLDGNVQQQGRIWDFAAPGLVLLELGGLVTDWRGRPVFPLGDLAVGHVPTIAAMPKAHRELVRCLRGHRVVVPRG